MKRLSLTLGLLATLLLLGAAAPYAPFGAPGASTYYGALYDGERGHLDVTLSAGLEYQFDGVCDINCSDLDFVLYRWNGTRWIWVTEDMAADDVPAVVARPNRTAVYRLIIVMADCTYSMRCRYEVDVY